MLLVKCPPATVNHPPTYRFPLPSTTFNTTATTQTITGLTNGTTYRLKVAAVNAVGTGPMSTISNPVTPSA